MEKELYIVVIDDDLDDVNLLIESYLIKPYKRGTDCFDFAAQNDVTKISICSRPEPSGNGWCGILEKIKATPILKSVPALVFTTGGTPAEQEICKKLDVQIFKKPSHIGEWESIALVMAAHCDPRLLKKVEW